MSGIIDLWSSNDNTYGHGIICKNCMVRKVAEPESSVQCVRVGTFVQVHSIREDNVFFYVVRNDMQVETDRLVCSRAAVIYVPENLWGPLFPVEQSMRLALVEDGKVAESMGNISVGHRVQVLGPDNKVICTGNVTFRNSIVRLGVGVYFGIKIETCKVLEAVTKGVSLLEPGTKGFPRGCDIVVTVDKLRPMNTYYNKEKLIYHYDKDVQRQKSPVGEDVTGPYYKSMIVLNLKDKFSNNSKRSVHQLSPDCNYSHSSVKKSINTDNPLLVGDRVVYLHGDTPERGVVRWIGNIKNNLKVGVEFDNPIGSGTGTVDGTELFRTKRHHALIVPPMALIKLSDYLMNTTNDTIQYKNNNVNYNNNNYNNMRSNDYCCDNKTNSDDKHRVARSNSHQCLKHPERTFYSDDTFSQRDEEPYARKQHSCLSTEKPQAESLCEMQLQHNSRSFDLSRPTERKISYRRQCNSVDNDLLQVKEPKSHPTYQASYNLSQRSPSQDVFDFVGPNWSKQERNHNCCWDERGTKSLDEEAHPSYKGVTTHEEPVDIHYEKGMCLMEVRAFVRGSKIDKTENKT
ncbi:hypothetical protein RUM44_007174 [Polyplax serrata]|uniref:CAP-Gly domain-containing protein n=1 Tax=Polyplax serrata TaxID=468196 RepID=A0ABR1B0F4_POLSC